MNAYSEDLRKKKIVEALERGTPNSEAARTFGVGLSSVKRYVATYREGRSLAPKQRPGSKPKLDGSARRLLEADLEERPAATLSQRREFLRQVRGVEVSDSTVCRVLGRLGWSRKKDRWERQRTRRVAEGGLANASGWRDLRRALGVRGRDGRQHLAGAPVCLVATRRASAREGAAQLGSENVTLLASMSTAGMGSCLAVEGSTTRKVFEAYLERVLVPSLKPGQVVVMDNLAAHKGGRVRELIEEKGCELMYLCHPTLARSQSHRGGVRQAQGVAAEGGSAYPRGAHIEAMGKALEAIER